MRTTATEKWDMLAPAFDAFKIPEAGRDDCLTLIKNLRLLNKNSTVMDVGCGAGRYAVAFARLCRSVTGTDLSPKMIAYAKKRAADMHLENIAFYCEDWDAVSVRNRHYQNRFDLVFAHMTPAVHNTQTLQKMQACSKNWCMLAGHIHREPPLTAKARQALGLSGRPAAGTYGAAQIFRDLWEQGKRPQIAYFEQERNTQRPADTELALLFAEVEAQLPLTPPIKEQLTRLAAAYTKEGVVHQTYRVPVFVMYWQVSSNQ